MTTCGECGRQAAEGDHFCSSCGAYLEWHEGEQSRRSAPAGGAARRAAAPGPVPAGPVSAGPVSAGPARAGPAPRPRTAGRPLPEPPSSGSPPPAPSPRPVPEPVPDVRRGVTLALPAEPLPVAAGSTAAVTARVRNVGSLVDEIALEVHGAPQPWTEVDPPRVPVYPGAEATVTLTFRPPRDPAVRAGLTPYTLTASSLQHAGATAQQPGRLDVGRFDDLTMSLVPHEARARRTTTHRLTFVNHGNADTRVEVTGADRQGELDVRPAAPVLTAGAGAEAQVLVQARARRWRWRGEECPRGFTVQARSDSGQALTATGVSVQQPLPLRLLVLAVSLLVAVLAVGTGSAVGFSLGGLLDGVRSVLPQAEEEPGGGGGGGGGGDGVPVVTVPDVEGRSPEEAASRLRQQGLGVAAQERETDDGVGSVVGSDPEEGEEVAAGTTVTLFVGVQQAVEVPDVVGESLDDALATLSDSGLEGRVVRGPLSSSGDTCLRRSSDGDVEEASCVVVQQAPGGGSGVSAGDTVRLAVAAEDA